MMAQMNYVPNVFIHARLAVDPIQLIVFLVKKPIPYLKENAFVRLTTMIVQQMRCVKNVMYPVINASEGVTIDV